MNTVNELKITVPVTCPYCGAITEVTMTKVEYDRYMNGELVQRIFPNASLTYRELLISGTCKRCQDNFWGPEENVA